MNTGLVVAVLVGCVALIGAVYVVYQRASGAKAEGHAPVNSAK